MLLQRWGRALRRTADAEKVGLLALPCGDPYEADEDQEAEWARLGLEAAPGRDRRAELDAGFDLACRLAECAVDPANLALGRLIAVVSGWRRARGAAGGSGADRDVVEDGEGEAAARDPPALGSLLQMRVARRGEGSLTHILTDADVALLQRMTGAIGRPLLPVPPRAEQEAERPGGAMPARKVPEGWAWGVWGKTLTRDYKNGTLKGEALAAFEASAPLMARAAAQEAKRAAKTAPDPPREEQIRLLTAEAERPDGALPAGEARKVPEGWAWGVWVENLTQAYKKGSLKGDVLAAFEASAPLMARAVAQEGKRAKKTAPDPPREEQIRLLTAEAERPGGALPAQKGARKEPEGWAWGKWVDALLQAYKKGTLTGDVLAEFEASEPLMARAAAQEAMRAKKTTPDPLRVERIRLLTEEAERPGGKLPAQGARKQPEDWAWGVWVNNLTQAYKKGKLKGDVLAAFEASGPLMARAKDQEARRAKKTARDPLREEQIRLLTEEAERQGGALPVREEPEGWAWGVWIHTLTQAYKKGTLKGEL